MAVAGVVYVRKEEFIEVAHTGRIVRLTAADQPGKMARLVKRDTICGTADDLEKGQQELEAEIQLSWDQKWATRL